MKNYVKVQKEVDDFISMTCDRCGKIRDMGSKMQEDSRYE